LVPDAAEHRATTAEAICWAMRLMSQNALHGAYRIIYGIVRQIEKLHAVGRRDRIQQPQSTGGFNCIIF
jgi:hypothetical protein